MLNIKFIPCYNPRQLEWSCMILSKRLYCYFTAVLSDPIRDHLTQSKYNAISHPFIPYCQTGERAQMSKKTISVKYFASGGRDSLQTSASVFVF